MTDTDDTDILLLIPPNFFLVQSSGSEDSLLESSRTVVRKPASCTAQVIGKLVNQVQTLESRLESLEITSDISAVGTLSKHSKTVNSNESFDTGSLGRKCHTFPRRRRKKTTKRERLQDSSLTSIDSVSTRRKQIPRLKLSDDIASYDYISRNSESCSMDGEISSIVSTPCKKNDKILLHEIDEFLTRVEAYESPESKYNSQDNTLNIENIIKSTGDYIAKKIDSKIETDVKLPSGKVVPSNVLDKYIYLVKNTSNLHSDKLHKSNNPTEVSSQPGNSQEVVGMSKTDEGKSPSVRKLNFDKEAQPTSTPKRLHSGTDSSTTFRPTSNKIYDRASKVLEQYKSNYSRDTLTSVTDSYSMSPKKEFKMPQMRPFPDNLRSLQNKFMDSIDTDLLSLNEMWGEKPERDERLNSVKLEEERLKREHCEAMIQQLQKKMLEQQEKLAVAIRVDRAKDIAISKLREAWLKLTGSLDKAEARHQNALERMVREVDNFRAVAEDAKKKTTHFESELYKALDLAHDYQEKCKQLTIEKRELGVSLEKVISNKNEIISKKDQELEVLKDNYETVMRLNKQSTDCVKNLEDALENEKLAHEQTKHKSSELVHRISSLDDERSLILQERDLLKDKVNEERGRCNMIERQLCEKQNLCSELLKKCDILDNESKSLRKHLELQKNELKEHYQKQLEDAVLSKLQEFQHQLDSAEREMENDVRNKEDAIVDSYNKQILRINEQHKLEIKVLEEKQKEEIKLYRLQLAQAGEKIGLLESKLECYRRRRGEIASQLHSVMESQWRKALLILTNGATTNNDVTSQYSRMDNASTPVLQELVPPKVPPLKMHTGGNDTHDRAQLRPEAVDMFNCGSLSDQELQQYVQMLLTKPPNLDGTEDSTAHAHRDMNEEPTSDRPDRHDRRDRNVKRSLSLSKPPWKS